MDKIVPGGDLHSPVARYLISLGARMVAWEEQVAIPLDDAAYYNP